VNKKAVALLLVLCAGPVAAHDSPGDVIHALSHRIEIEGPTARLLAARAVEYQSLGDWSAAIEDFDRAVALQPRFGAALQGLAAAHLHQQDWAAAEAAARGAIDLYTEPGQRAPGEALLAQTLAAQSRWEEALTAWRGALQSPSPEVDWFLGEATCLGRLGRFSDQVLALAAAKSRNPSVVLHRAWVRALVDGGQLDAAETEIEKGLGQARWQSTWLLLRARVHGRRGDLARQQADAALALAELESRMNPERPDAWLTTECGLALALSGDVEGARICEKQARDLGVPGADLLEIHQLLGVTTPTSP
jgi:tetratricopeptide (TPR) repeat protein